MIDKSLKQRIYVDTQDSSFVQCVSPNNYNYSDSVRDRISFGESVRAKRYFATKKKQELKRVFFE